MRKYWARFFVLLLILGGLSSFNFAQSGRHHSAPRPKTTEAPADSTNPSTSPSSASPTPAAARAVAGDDNTEGATTLKIDATLVTVPVVVSDQAGRYVPFLKAEDFKLYEDSVAQEISFFASERVPFNVALVLDTSGSIRDSMGAIQESAIRFVHELREEDRVMVVQFNSRVEVLNDLTSDRYKIRHSIEITRAGGGTKIYDALIETASRMKSVEGRKAIILLTDGEDTESHASAKQAIEAVTEAGALMFVIQFPSSVGSYSSGPIIGMPPTFPGGRRGGGGYGNYPDSSFLHDLVDSTGGDMFYAGGRAGLPNVWHKIAEELRYVYVLGYYPTNAIENGGHRQIRVQLSQSNIGKIRYKPGYTATKHPKQQAD